MVTWELSPHSNELECVNPRTENTHHSGVRQPWRDTQKNENPGDGSSATQYGLGGGGDVSAPGLVRPQT